MGELAFDLNSNPAFDFSSFDPVNVVEIDLNGDYFRRNWAALLSEWATRPPFYVTTQGVPQCLLCCRYEDVHAVYTDPQEQFSTTIPDLPGYERFDFFHGAVDIGHVNGAQHQRLRRLMAPPFGPAGVAKLQNLIQSVTTEMLDRVAGQDGQFDLMGDFSVHLIDRIVLDGMFKIKAEQRSAFIRMGACLTLVAGIPPGGEFPQEFEDALAETSRAINALVEERRRHLGDDFVSLLIGESPRVAAANAGGNEPSSHHGSRMARQ